jgi:hypothetical protein
MIQCAGRLSKQHIISKGMARGNEQVRLEITVEELLANVCLEHNTSKIADTRVARKILLLQAINQYGWDRIETAVDGLPWKVHQHSLTLRAMLE